MKKINSFADVNKLYNKGINIVKAVSLKVVHHAMTKDLQNVMNN